MAKKSRLLANLSHTILYYTGTFVLKLLNQKFMKRVILLSIVLLFSYTSFSQTQLGNTLWGEINEGYEYPYSLPFIGKSALNFEGNRLAVSEMRHRVNDFAVGRVKVFDIINGTWQQVGQELLGDTTTEANSFFGTDISFNASGTIMAIGAMRGKVNGYTDSGYVEVYQLVNNQWELMGDRLTSGEQAWERFGFKTKLSSDGLTLLVTAPFNDVGNYNSGKVQVFKYISGTWTQVGSTLKGIYASLFGIGAAISGDGNRILIGGYQEDPYNPADAKEYGAIRVFDWNGTDWEQTGNTIYGSEEFSQYGLRVDMSKDGNRIATSDIRNDDNGENTGYVIIFEYNGTTWEQVGNKIKGTMEGERMGYDIDFTTDGGKILVGTGSSILTENPGVAKLFEFSNGNWNQLGETMVSETLSGNVEGDHFGMINAINADGSVLAISAWKAINSDGEIAGNLKTFYFPPHVSCQDIDVALDENGNATITAQDVDNGSYDVDEPISLILDIEGQTFTCNDVGNSFEATLSATDSHGNTDSCSTTITIVDTMAPNLVCQELTIALDQNGTASITANDVIESVTDNCQVETTAVDVPDFSCEDTSNPVTVTVFASDINGNYVSCTTTVTVVDALAPEIVCLNNQTVTADETTNQYTLPDYWNTGEITATDNCSNTITYTQTPAAGTNLSPGIYTIVVTAQDEYGNQSSCSFELTVETVLGMEDTLLKNEITVYPNPANNYIKINYPLTVQINRTTIYDVNGKEIISNNYDKNTRIDVSSFSSGLYFIQIETRNTILIKRFIKE